MLKVEYIFKIFLMVSVITTLVVVTLLFVSTQMKKGKMQSKIAGWEIIIILGGVVFLLGLLDKIGFITVTYMAIGLGLIVKSILKIIDLKIEKKKEEILTKNK